MKRLVTGALAVVSLLAAGCSGYEKVDEKLEPKAQAAAQVPKELTQTVNMDKVLSEVGDRKEQLATLLAHSRDLIDQGKTNLLMEDASKLAVIFPEINMENSRIYSFGKGQEMGASPSNPALFNQKAQQKYEHLKNLDLIPFLDHLRQKYSDAFMHSRESSRDTELSEMKIKDARDTFDMLSQFFSSK